MTTGAPFPGDAPDEMPPAPASAPRASFAHASEAELGRILDFYAVRWEYEPITFPILWNTDGDVVESFAPDFYLPDFDLFVELTTLKQRLVRKKNRKLRRLRELYPDIRIKLLYARDFRAILLKYGKLGLLESLSGTLGQVVPDRGVVIEGPAAFALAPAITADATSATIPRTRRSRSGSERRRRRRAAVEARAASLVALAGGSPTIRTDEEERAQR